MPFKNDSQFTQFVDRIRATAFKEARDAFLKSKEKNGKADDNLFSRAWVAKRLKRSESFVKHNWARDPYEAVDSQRSGRPLLLSQGSVEVITSNSNKKKRSNAAGSM